VKLARRHDGIDRNVASCSVNLVLPAQHATCSYLAPTRSPMNPSSSSQGKLVSI
jgi:hypothetical protein